MADLIAEARNDASQVLMYLPFSFSYLLQAVMLVDADMLIN